MGIKIEKAPHLRIKVSDPIKGGFIESQTVTNQLLFAILQELKEMRTELNAISVTFKRF